MHVKTIQHAQRLGEYQARYQPKQFFRCAGANFFSLYPEGLLWLISIHIYQSFSIKSRMQVPPPLFQRANIKLAF